MVQPHLFSQDAYELVVGERVHIPDHQLDHNRQGQMSIWIESSERGKRFLSQITVQGNLCAVRAQTYTQECYILRDRRTGRYWFLDRNACGFWLQNESFFGSRSFIDTEAIKIQDWLDQRERAV